MTDLAADATNTSVSVTWSPPLDANGVIFSYEVTLTSADMSTSSPATLTVMPGSNLEAIFSELRVFTDYTVSVRPFTSNGSIAGISTAVNFTTDAGSKWVN